jgi:hypothetical protein
MFISGAIWKSNHWYYSIPSLTLNKENEWEENRIRNSREGITRKPSKVLNTVMVAVPYVRRTKQLWVSNPACSG